jgi:triacylglycerol lipase
MVARIQQALVIGCLGLAFAWLMIGWERSPVWAIVGALGILVLHVFVLGLEFLLLGWISRASAPPGRPTFRQMLYAWWRESVTSTIVFGWRQPFRSRQFPDWSGQPGAGATRRGVVLVHGFVCNRGLWNPWMRALQKHGCPTFAVNLEPMHGSIDDYAPIIEAAVSKATAATGLPPLLVGHSMGGLAIRAWMRRVDADARVHHVVTIGTPHHGTWLGQFSHAVNGRQMRLHSRWLTQLAAQEPLQRNQRFTCWYSNCDNIVMPAATATLEGADNRRVPGAAHVELAYRPEILADVLARTPIL